MSNCLILLAILSGIHSVKVIVNSVAEIKIYNTTSWLSYASWTWEILRRNQGYISYYNALRNKGFETLSPKEKLTLTKANQHYPTANNFGLLAPADPSKFAGEQAVFWCPKAFDNVVRFHVIDPANVGRKKKPFQLSQMKGVKTHFLDANGTYHIRILGERFWFQLQCDNIDFVDENAYLGFEINVLQNPDKRLDTIKQIGGVYDGSLDLASRLHVPARLESHQRSTLAYDIRTAGGSITDVVNAFLETGLVTVDPEKFVDFTNLAQNAFRAGKAYINGDYLKVLNRQ